MLAEFIASKVQTRGKVVRDVTFDDVAVLYTDCVGSKIDAWGGRS